MHVDNIIFLAKILEDYEYLDAVLDEEAEDFKNEEEIEVLLDSEEVPQVLEVVRKNFAEVWIWQAFLNGRWVFLIFSII